MANEQWGSTIHKFYGTRPYWERTEREYEEPKTFRGGGGLQVERCADCLRTVGSRALRAELSL